MLIRASSGSGGSGGSFTISWNEWNTQTDGNFVVNCTNAVYMLGQETGATQNGLGYVDNGVLYHLSPTVGRSSATYQNGTLTLSCPSYAGYVKIGYN